MAGMLGKVSSSEPQHRLGRVVPEHKTPMAAQGCRVCTVPQKGTLCHLAEDSTELFCTPPRRSSWPPPCLSASKTKSYYAEWIAPERKKGGGIISAGVFMWFFFYIFKSHWEPHYNLVISRRKRNQISKRNLTSTKKMYFKGRRKINRMKVLQSSKQLQIVDSNISGSPIGSELLWGQILITDPSVLLDGTGSVPQTHRPNRHLGQEHASNSEQDYVIPLLSLLPQALHLETLWKPTHIFSCPFSSAPHSRERHSAYSHIIRK